MNKTAIKNFAIWARNKLIADISYRAGLMGITADGIQKALPQSTGTTEFYDIGTAEPYSISRDAVKQRKHLVELIQRKEKETNYKTAYKYVLEEVAYTWFNRLIAVRFMEINDYLPSHIRVLSSDSGKMEPDLVTNPFSAGLSFTSDEEQAIYQLKQKNKLDEVFRILFIKQCNALNENLPALFEKTNDYTELLLNLSVIDQDSVVYHLVHDIPEEDFDVERGGQVEIIGWLYQYYNTEPKNEAFAKKGKITKEEVPAVTQLFTPDWIVRYMVENSLGRLWVEGHPNEGLKAGWKYYLEEAEQEPEVRVKLAEIRAEYAKLNPEDIKVIDPCMGSGHILVYAFDVLMQIYESAGYSQRDAAKSILENNLYGLDIDDRAFQMAYFAVMMKARQYNRRILNGEYKPNVYSIQESNEINRNQLKYFGAGLNDFEKNKAITQMKELLDAFKDAKEYGSILTVDQYDWDLLNRFASENDVIGQMSMYTVGIDETAEQLKQMVAQGKVLAQKYHVTTTNPPYMGLNNGSSKLSDYAKKNYKNSKSDMFAMFIERAGSFTKTVGFVGMITQHSWMFLSSFESMRTKLLHTEDIVSMAHLGLGTFEDLNSKVVQSVAFILRKNHIKNYLGAYDRLFKKQGAFENNELKERWLFTGERRYFITQNTFYDIPGCVIAYWISDKIVEAFRNGLKADSISAPKQGLATGDNNKFLRLWFEVDDKDVCLSCDSHEQALVCGARWFPYNKGGGYRKWYGNNVYLINWEHDGAELKAFKGSVLRSPQYYFKDCASWCKVTTSFFSMRYIPKGFLFDVAGCSLFTEEHYLYYMMGFYNSSVARYIFSLISPTLNYEVGHVASMPILIDESKKPLVERLVKENIQIAKEEWDSHEISWDYKRNPLVLQCSTIKDSFEKWKNACSEKIKKLRRNEEELNKIFANIYGVSEEIDSRISDEELSISVPTREMSIKELLSYAIGCMFGRYSLTKDGTIPVSLMTDLTVYGKFVPDEDNVVPITDEEYLADDIVNRLCEWLKFAFSESTLEENLDYIATSLPNKGETSRTTIRNYYINDFYKDHCSMYSVAGSGKRPIYWMFDSGKENAFKALISIHRYNENTIGNLRIDYLHRIQRIYENEVERMQDIIEHSADNREVSKAERRMEKLRKQIKECREYDESVAHLALTRRTLALNDGIKANYENIQKASDGKRYNVLAKI